MLALLGASHDDAQAVCNEQAQGQILVCANYNAPGQVVISGDVAAIDRAEQAWKADKRRCARLATAGAFHSPLMAEAAAEVGAFARTLRFTRPRVPVYCNTDAAPFVVSEAAERLAGQVENPVLFEQSVARLIEDGADEFVETGFGGVLFGLVKRINRGTDRARVGTRDEFDSYVDSLPAKL